MDEIYAIAVVCPLSKLNHCTQYSQARITLTTATLATFSVVDLTSLGHTPAFLEASLPIVILILTKI